MTPPATRSRTICHMLAAAARVQPGGRLVEEDHLRAADQGHRQVEPPPHAAGVGRRRLAGRVGQVELLEQLARRRRRPSARSRWCRSAISSRFSSPVSRLSTAENWPVTPIAARTASGSRATSWPATRALAGVGADQRGQDLDGGGLPGAVRAEQREDRSRRDGQVDAVEHDVVAERLAQPGHGDRRPGLLGGHGFSLRVGAGQERRIGDVAEGGAAAHLDGLVGLVRAGRRRPAGCARARTPVFTSSQAAVPSAMPIVQVALGGRRARPSRGPPRRGGCCRWTSWRRRRRRPARRRCRRWPRAPARRR